MLPRVTIPAVFQSSFLLLLTLFLFSWSIESPLSAYASRFLLANHQQVTLSSQWMPDHLPVGNIERVTSGEAHNCALTTTKAVHCWGWNIDGQLGDGTTRPTTVPVTLTGLESGVQSIAAGGSHTCALLEDGTLTCWGNNAYGQLGDGTTDSRIAPVEIANQGRAIIDLAAGYLHTCALLENGAVSCWGDNQHGQLGSNGTTTSSSQPTPVAGLTGAILQLSAGGDHTCAVSTEGAVFCWGNNDSGQLGDGSTISSSAPVTVVGLTERIQMVKTGNQHSCALSETGLIFCWGNNDSGQLGDGTQTSRMMPVAVRGLRGVATDLGAGYFHTCALIGDAEVNCWGTNNDGQLGVGTLEYHSVPAPVIGLDEPLAGLAIGFAHSCIVTNSGNVKCWGDNSYGQLGDGAVMYQPEPIVVSDSTVPATAISAGTWHSCAVRENGSADCWGNDSSGRLGNGDGVSSSIPAEVVGLSGQMITAIASGDSHSCGVANQFAYCWGDNGYGQLGADVEGTTSAPSPVGGSSAVPVEIITTGLGHSCTVTLGKAIYCWGRNDFGQLGDGTADSSKTPQSVFLNSNAQDVSAGWFHTCALSVGGEAFCWGNNEYGQLGDGSFVNRTIATSVIGLADSVSSIIDISSGKAHSCAVKDTGDAFCWGNNEFGQLGDDSGQIQRTQVAVVGLAGVVGAISAGENHTCAITKGGGVACWGDNFYGQLGDGTYDESRIPVAVAGLSSNMVAVSAGSNHTCALKDDGTIYCWGNDEHGRLGTGRLINSLLPIDALGFPVEEPQPDPTPSAATIFEDSFDEPLGNWSQAESVITQNGAAIINPAAQTSTYVQGRLSVGEQQWRAYRIYAEIDLVDLPFAGEQTDFDMNREIILLLYHQEGTDSFVGVSLNNQSGMEYSPRIFDFDESGASQIGQLASVTGATNLQFTVVIDATPERITIRVNDQLLGTIDSPPYGSGGAGILMKTFGLDTQSPRVNYFRVESLEPEITPSPSDTPTPTSTPSPTNTMTSTNTPTATATSSTPGDRPPTVSPMPTSTVTGEGSGSQQIYLPYLNVIPAPTPTPSPTALPGLTWTSVGSGPQTVDSVAINGTTLFATDRSAGSGGLYQRGIDGCQNGTGFTQNRSIPTSASAIEFGGTLGLTAAFSSGIYYSQNSGTTWSEASGIEGEAYSVAFVDGNGYAGAGNSVYRSEDGGATWQSIVAVDKPINVIRRISTSLWLGTEGNGVQELPIGTSVLIPRNGGLISPKSQEIWDIYIDGIDALYIATYDGVYRGTGIGSWSPVGDNLAEVEARTLAAVGDTLYVGTRGQGVYSISLSNPTTWTQVTNGHPASSGWTVRDLLYDGANCGGLLAGADEGVWLLR